MAVKANIAPGSFLRVAGVAGIGFAAAIVLANALLVPLGLPVTGADAADVIAFFTTRQTALGFASSVMPAAWLAAVVFGVGAWTAVRRRGRDQDQGWALVGLAGVVLQNGAFAVVASIRLALPRADSDVVPALWGVHDAVFTLNGVFLATALIGLSAGGAGAGLISRWHAWLGFASAALLFASATLTPLVVAEAGPLGLLGLAGWLMWVVWLVAYGIELVRAR
ncbi:hypothetical protein [Lentzea sp. NPDC003310]|uniref:hypothetical protein n=1 Tax=Lentzea sp. NPDC003310 TaxID=3154447 RepID=UPI0033A9291C